MPQPPSSRPISIGEVMDALYQASAKASDRTERRRWNSSESDGASGDGLARTGRRVVGSAQGRRHFTHSKVMAWVAFDRAIRSGSGVRLQSAPWIVGAPFAMKSMRSVCTRGIDSSVGRSSRATASTALDASALLHFAGRLSATLRPRIRAHRRGDRARTSCRTASSADIILRAPAGTASRGTRAPSSPAAFWYADNLVLWDAKAEARELFEHLLSLRNDVGLLSRNSMPGGGCSAISRRPSPTSP